MNLLHSPDADGTDAQIKTSTASLMGTVRSERDQFAALEKMAGSVSNLTHMDMNQCYLVGATLAKLRDVLQKMIEVEQALYVAQGDEDAIPKDEDINRLYKEMLAAQGRT